MCWMANLWGMCSEWQIWHGCFVKGGNLCFSRGGENAMGCLAWIFCPLDGLSSSKSVFPSIKDDLAFSK